MRCIVAATDGSDAADRAIDFAADLASKFGAGLVLTYVIAPAATASAHTSPVRSLANVRAPTRIEDASLSEVVREMAEELLRKAKGRAEARGALHVDIAVRVGEPTEVILALAEERKADTIVLGKRGQGRLAGLLLGSVSQRVTTLARCAVVVIP